MLTMLNRSAGDSFARATRAIPVSVVTGTDTSNLDRSEFACVLEKPISADELLDAVHTCWNSARR